MNKVALIIVDVQNDFVEGGALAVAGGKALVPEINKLVAQLGDRVQVVASQDWHPLETAHFQQWPVHCVGGSKGAELVDGLVLPENTIRVLKGTGTSDDGYSAFDGKTLARVGKDATPLGAELDMMGICTVYVCGIALNFCVGATVKDAIKRGYKTVLVENCTVGIPNVNPSPEGTLNELATMGCQFMKVF